MQGWELAVKQYNFYWGICIVWMQQILGTVTFTISHHFTYSEKDNNMFNTSQHLQTILDKHVILFFCKLKKI